MSVPTRADARRNREAILEAAGELFAQRGNDVQMEEIAQRAGLGMGTLYRNFATKQALLAAIIGRRFAAMAELARKAERIEDPGAAFDALLETYFEAAEADAAFRFGLLGPEEPAWEDIADQKTAFSDVADRVIARAKAAHYLRADFTIADFILIARGVMVNMTADDDWRRLLSFALQGIRATGP